jgi:hypothetical protein
LIDDTLAWLRGRLESAYGLTDYVLFGSTVLYLHGLREAESVGDVDVFVSRRVFDHLTDPRFRLTAVPEWSREEPTPRRPAIPALEDVAARLRVLHMDAAGRVDEREALLRRRRARTRLELRRRSRRSATTSGTPAATTASERSTNADLRTLDYVLGD